MSIEKLPIQPVELQPLTDKVDVLASKVDIVDEVVDSIKVKTDTLTFMRNQLTTIDNLTDAIKVKTDLLTGIKSDIDGLETVVGAIKTKTDGFNNQGIKSWQRLVKENSYSDDRGRHLTFTLSPQVNPAKCLVTINGFDSGYYHNTHIMRHISEFTSDHITLTRCSADYIWSRYWRPATYSIVIIEYW